jgi:hypothetical protein
MKDAVVIDRRRIRTNEGSFAYIPHRFLRGGFFSACTVLERSLYLLLVLAADRRGVSFYSRESMAERNGLRLEQVFRALEGLEAKDLVACEGSFVQVLSLPPSPAAMEVRRGVRRESSPVSVAEALHAFALEMDGKTRSR